MRQRSFLRCAGLITSSFLVFTLVTSFPAGANSALAQGSCAGSCVTISPASGPPGTTVTAAGSAWPAGDQIQAIWGSTSGPDVGSPVTVSSNGTFTLSFTVPTNAALGSTQVFFWDIQGRYFEVADNSFDVTPPVSVTSVSTWGFFLQNNDTSNKAAAHVATQFTPGEVIEYVAYVSNSGTTAVTETYSYVVTNPSGSKVYSWSGSVAVAPGSNGYILPSVIPNAPPAGTYTISVTVSLNGASSSGKATFTVAGQSRTLGKVLNSTNPYANGQCTYGADAIFASYTSELYYPSGRYLPNFGNAYSWATAAASSVNGWTVSSTPQLNSIVVFQPGTDGTDPTDGHVAWVTGVNGSTITVDEMNGDGKATPNKYDYHSYTPDASSGIRYILATDTSSSTWAQVAASVSSRTASVSRAANSGA